MAMPSPSPHHPRQHSHFYPPNYSMAIPSSSPHHHPCFVRVSFLPVIPPTPARQPQKKGVQPSWTNNNVGYVVHSKRPLMTYNPHFKTQHSQCPFHWHSFADKSLNNLLLSEEWLIAIYKHPLHIR